MGEIARSLGFWSPTIFEVITSMTENTCDKQVDILKAVDGNALLDAYNQTIPLWVWLCKDGTVVRVKPIGDPTNKFDKQPLGSVAVRYPCNATFTSFDDEMFKVDSSGNPIPKWGPNLDSKDPAIIKLWARAAHFPVNTTGFSLDG